LTTYATKTCEELKEALDTARASLESPRMGAATDVNDIVAETGSADPEVTQPDLMKDIEEIEQAMREAGCA
jgi:hypothetical protein